jgi:hypothetical protein
MSGMQCFTVEGMAQLIVSMFSADVKAKTSSETLRNTNTSNKTVSIRLSLDSQDCTLAIQFSWIHEPPKPPEERSSKEISSTSKYPRSGPFPFD